MVFFLPYIIIINIVAYCLYRIDKKRALQGEYRIRESVLLGVAFAGGALGAFCAMLEYRHKTLHSAFAIGVPIALVLQMALIIWAIVYCLMAT